VLYFNDGAADALDALAAAKPDTTTPPARQPDIIK